MASALSQADSTLSAPYVFANLMSPRHDLNPCSGWGRLSRICCTSFLVYGPVWLAQEIILLGVQSAYLRWLLGMCSGSVVWPPFTRLRRWLATRFPLSRHSTVSAVTRISNCFLTRRWGTE